MVQATTEKAALIRDAREDDMGAVMEIYNDAVANTTAIWNDEQVDLENRLDWFRTRRGRGFPVLVAELDGRVVGYASYGDWRAFDGYRHTAEHSIYVHRNHRGQGIGRMLLERLVERATDQQFHVMVGGIDRDNTASIALHEKLGFEPAGVIRHAGYKFGRWLDLAFYQRVLSGPREPTET